MIFKVTKWPATLSKEPKEYYRLNINNNILNSWRSVSLVRISDVRDGEDSRQNVDDSMDQETSQSLIPLSPTQDPGLSIAESSQSIIPHSQEYGLRSTEENPGIDDIYSWGLSASNQKGSSSDKMGEGHRN